jgi:lipopolysaccharide biosynthesis glycosyltransferase
MLDFKTWIKTNNFADKPWMVLGKGPTYAEINKVGIEKYNTLSLNHVVRERHVDIAHIIDIEVVEACADVLLTNCDWLLMPRIPNVGSLPGSFVTIEDWIRNIPILQEVEKQGKLVVYDLVIAEKGKNPLDIPLLYFSSEAALGVLGRMGVKTVRSLGVDGGRKYSSSFQDLNSQTNLINGQPSFDLQFDRLEAIAQDFQIDYRPMIEPMLIFVGADVSQDIAARVLEYSIHKHATRPVRVVALTSVEMPTPKHESNRARTGFSFVRFAIPKLAKYRGRALYVDSDMLVFTDVAELWNIEFGEQKILCTTQQLPEAWNDFKWAHPGRQFSVMMLDCSRLPWDLTDIVKGLDEEKYTYPQLMFEMCLVKPNEIDDRIPPRWNCLEHYEEGESSLLHYTVVPTQPWRVDNNINGQVWVKAFEEAVLAGWISLKQVMDSLEKGYLRESLAYVADLAKNDLHGTPIENASIGFSQRLQSLVKAYQSTYQQCEIEKVNANDAKVAELKAMKQFQKADAELTETKEKLAIAQAELEKYRTYLKETIETAETVEEEYRRRVLQLESEKTGLYSSTTWKIGRLITKPAGILKKP